MAPAKSESVPRTTRLCLGLLPGRRGKFSPSNELDILFPKQLAKFLACKKVEITLTPGSAPRIAFPRGGFHFVISIGQVDDEFSNARLQILEGGSIEIIPLLRGDAGTDGYGVVEDDISGTQTRFEVGVVCEPIFRDENRQLVIVSDTKKDVEEFLSVID